MGYITSGGYSLSRGRPFGVGAVALSKIAGAKKQMLTWVLSSPTRLYDDAAP
jgi:hypothetical protein